MSIRSKMPFLAISEFREIFCVIFVPFFKPTSILGECLEPWEDAWRLLLLLSGARLVGSLGGLRRVPSHPPYICTGGV